MLAIVLLLAAVLFAGQSRAAALSIGLSSTSPSLGNIASGTASTTFTVAAGSGAVSIGSGGAQFIPYNAVRSSKTTITVNCSGGGQCHQSNVTITITAGSATGRLGPVNSLAVDFGNGATAQYVSGTTSCASCSSMTFVIKPVATSGNSGSATFNLGLTVPVTTSGTLGNATAAYTVQAASSGLTTGVGGAAVTAIIQGKLGIQNASNLSYGRIVLVANKSGKMTWDASTRALAYAPSDVVVQKGSPSIAAFDVTGTPQQIVNFSIAGNAGLPGSIRLTNQKGQPLDITLSTTAQSSQTITNDGTFRFYVGGTLNLAPTMNTGAYSGSFQITVNYQ